MRFELPDSKTLSFEMVIPIRWGDMDAMGHVNNASYFRYLETLRIDWFHSIGCLSNPGAVGGACGPVIINAFCSFIRQLEYPGDVLARHYIGGMGRSTLDTYATLERVDRPGEVCATGGATVVWTDFKAQKSVPIPAHYRAQFGG